MIKVEDKEKCCGCSACVSICPRNCISMVFDEEGSEYPAINESSCINCGLCEQVCPCLHTREGNPTSQRGYVVQHNDDKILSESTSGGAFTAMAQAVLTNGGIVYGAGWIADHGLSREQGAPEGMLVGHFPIEDEAGLHRFRNSKYVQSIMGSTFSEVKASLREGREVLFSGTPCQCEGLLNYLRKPYQNLITVDFVCHAVPSRIAFVRYLEWLEKKIGKTPESIRFRDKGNYGYRYSNVCALGGCGEEAPYVSVEYSNGVESDPYMRAFFSDICDRPSCYSCPSKGRYRKTDVTIWDFFDVGRLCPELDNNKGVTRALVHTNKGDELMSRINDFASVVEVDPDSMVSDFKEMFFSVDKNANRADFMADAVKLDGVSLYEKWFPDTLAVKLERLVRRTLSNLGAYDQVKFFLKKLLGR